MGPTITAWLPSYSHAAYLPAAIESVLGQTFQDFELVIVEDGSTDGSLEIAERYAAAHPDRVTVLTHDGHVNRGIAASADLAIAHGTGRFLGGVASDDTLYPDTFERQVEYLERHPEVGFVYGYAHLIDEDGRRVPHARTVGIDLTGDGRFVERLVQGNTIPSMASMIRRECMDQAGPYDPALAYQDWELFVRAAAHWEVGFIPRVLADYRMHSTNVSVGSSRETNVERALEVTSALRERALDVGGRLAEPRVRATLELQMCFLLFADGRAPDAEAALEAAFERDPSLASDGRWLGDWLWSRELDGLLPDDGPDFVPWLAERALPRLDAQGARAFRREAAAAEMGARALRLARAGRSAAAIRSALAAGARSPRRLRDRRLGAWLLDSSASAARSVRFAKRTLVRHR